jgi:O-antigen ligase
VRYYSLSLYKDVLSNISKGIIVIVLGTLLGATLVNCSNQALVMTGAGVLLFAFLIQPAKLLLGYLVALPIIDQLIPFFTSRLLGLQRFGPQILFRGGLTVLFIFYWLINQRNPFSFKVAVPMFVLLLLLAVTTIASGVEIQSGLVSLAKLAFWMFLLLIVADMVAQQEIELRVVYRCVIISVLIFAASLLISQLFFGARHVHYGVGEFSGVFGGHNLALCLCMGLIVLLASAITQQSRLLMLLLFLLCSLTVVSILRTYVRTAYAASATVFLTFSLMFWIYEKGEHSKRQKAVLCLALVITIGIVALYVSTHATSITQRFSDFSNPARAGSGRLLIYKAAIASYQEYSIFGKLFGQGLGAAISYYPGTRISTHNDYISILLSGGLMGIVLYFFVFIELWRQVKSTAQNSHLPFVIAGTTIATYLVAAISDNVMQFVSPMTYFGFLIGGAMGYYGIEERGDIVHRLS